MTSKEIYTDKGYIVLRQYFNKNKINEINIVIDKLYETLIKNPTDSVFLEEGKIKQVQYLYNYNSLFEQICEELRPIAIELTGCQDLNILNMQLFEKNPQISKPTRPHQDNAYFKVNPHNAITFWIALDDIDEDNGCLYYAEKSHKNGTYTHSRYSHNTTFRIRSGVAGLSLCLPNHDESKDTKIIVSAGDIAIHHCDTIHRAGKNNTINRRRRAIGIVFIPKICGQDKKLMEFYTKQLQEDILLQTNKNMTILPL